MAKINAVSVFFVAMLGVVVLGVILYVVAR